MAYDDRGNLRAIWKRSPEPSEIEPPSPVPRIAYVILLAMGLVALLGIGISVSNYVSSVSSVRGLRLEIISLQFIDDGNPRTEIHFRLHNHSPLPIKVDSYSFVLYLNGERVDSSNSTYKGTDPNVDPAIYSKASRIDQVLAANHHLDLQFTLYIYPRQQEIIRQGLRSGSMIWVTDATLRVIFPYTREMERIQLATTFEE